MTKIFYDCAVSARSALQSDAVDGCSYSARPDTADLSHSFALLSINQFNRFFSCMPSRHSSLLAGCQRLEARPPSQKSAPGAPSQNIAIGANIRVRVEVNS